MIISNIFKIIPSPSTLYHYKTVVKTKISEVAFKIFEKLGQYVLTTLDFIWPLPDPTREPKGEIKSEGGQVTKRLLKSLKKSNETREERALIAAQKEKEQYYLQTPTTSLFLGVNYALVPFTLFITPNQNFIASAIAADNITNILSWYFYGKLNLDFLEKYGLIRKQKEPDEIGRFFYGTTLFLTFQKINEINPSLSPHLNAASALIQAPFLQNFFLNLPLVSNLNEKLHISLRDIKIKTKKQLAYALVKISICITEKLLLPKLDASFVALEKKRPEWTNKFAFTYFASVAEEQVEETAADLATFITDKASDSIAEGIINTVVSTAKSIIYLHYLNRMLTYSIIRHPIMSAAQLILAGGISKEPFDFGLKIGGVFTLLATGSSKLALTFIYLPKLGLKFLRMRQRQLKKIKRDDPLINAVANLFTKKIKALSKEKEEIKPDEILEQIEAETEIKEEKIKPTKKNPTPSYINYALAGAAGAILTNKIPFHFHHQNNPPKNTLSQPKTDAEFEEVYQDKILNNAYKEVTSKETNPLLDEFLRKNPARL